MTFDTSIFSRAAVATFGIQWIGFVVAYLFQTEIFYDILGGINYMVLAFLGHWQRMEPSSTRHSSMTCVFLASRGWLLLFLAWRAHSRGGDSRFDDFKHKPAMFWLVWTAQAMWVFLVSWPLLVVQALDDGTATIPQQEMTLWDKIMLLGFGLGVSIEIQADIQKAVWVSQGRPGGFCNVGLWNVSRHPNYFGEIFQWWCAWLLSCGSLAVNINPDTDTKAVLFCFLGILSPLFTMNVLLNMNGTGIWAAEGKNLKRHYESEHAEAYKEYRQSTSPLIPMVGYKNIPLSIKRRFLFEWERFEYRPSSTTDKKKG